MPAKKKTSAKTANKTEKTVSKADFIRGFGPDVSAEEIISQAKSKGLQLTKKYVWTKQSEIRKERGTPAKEAVAAPAPQASVRKTGKKAASKGKKASKALKPGPQATVASKPATKPAAGDAAQRMTTLILELGTVRADALYRDVRARLDAIVGQG